MNKSGLIFLKQFHQVTVFLEFQDLLSPCYFVKIDLFSLAKAPAARHTVPLPVTGVGSPEARGFSQEELLKIWKGLFYCMWVQDEPLLQVSSQTRSSEFSPQAGRCISAGRALRVQEELANTISQLIHVVNNSEAQHLFIQTFWQTMNREWKGIDQLRLDKFYMLIRLVLRQSFEVLKRNGWEESRIKLFLDVLMKEILRPESQSPNGVKFHFIDIYVDELSKVGGKEVRSGQMPCTENSVTRALAQTIARAVLHVIVEQSPPVPGEAVEGQKPKGSDGGLSEEEIPENEATWRKPISKKRRVFLPTVSGLTPATCKSPCERPLEALPLELRSADRLHPPCSDIPQCMAQDTLGLSPLGERRPEYSKICLKGSSGALSPLKKKLRTEKDFVKFDASFCPKPLFFRKAKGSTATTSPGAPLQPSFQLCYCPRHAGPCSGSGVSSEASRTPSSSKKVTFGLSRNMTAEFKKTDKSILVSPTGPSRVAFNPEQRPLHGVLKTPTSSPASTPLGTKKPLTATPKRRPTAVDFI
ncbi:ribosomal RNA processing protein 1 B-like protein [Camelus ferus]|nr:ribosomal RNA processing protein 1 B-like protein [Camelus ferus]